MKNEEAAKAREQYILAGLKRKNSKTGGNSREARYRGRKMVRKTTSKRAKGMSCLPWFREAETKFRGVLRKSPGPTKKRGKKETGGEHTSR